jgi:hypothetical protein
MLFIVSLDMINSFQKVMQIFILQIDLCAMKDYVRPMNQALPLPWKPALLGIQQKNYSNVSQSEVE